MAAASMRIVKIFLALLMVAAGAGSLAAAEGRGVKLAPRGQEPAATAAGRIALVIGNGSYSDAPLQNPVHDAGDVAAMLRQAGFSVTLKNNANQQEMERAIEDFTRRIRRGSTALFFYAGHGMLVEGRNFLIPVGREIQSESDVKYRSVEVGELLERMERAEASTNIVILDACRNNPFARSFRSAQRGLALQTAPRNSIIIFATAAGQTAADGAGRNGLFTKHFLKNVATPGVDIEQMLRRVRSGVQRESGGKQVPYTNSSLTSEHFSLNPGKGGGAPPAPEQEAASGAQESQQAQHPFPSGTRESTLAGGVEMRETPRPDGSLALRFTASASSDAADPLTWRATAKREAERKIRKAVEAVLSQPPYRLSGESIERVRSQGRQVEVEFREREQGIAITYEMLLRIQQQAQTP